MKDLAIKDLEKCKRAEKAEAQARKDAASRERKARRDHEEKHRKERRKASKERAKQNKEDKALKHAEEKRVKDYYGIRGYDPNAGMLRSNREGDGGEHAGEGTKAGQARHGPPTQRFHAEQTWGFEYGKPKQHDGKGHFSGHHKNCGEHYGSSAAAIGDGD
jgi:membrane protein involved in colicin uptake